MGAWEVIDLDGYQRQWPCSVQNDYILFFVGVRKSLNSRIDVGSKDVMARERDFAKDNHCRYCYWRFLLQTVFSTVAPFSGTCLGGKGWRLETKVLYFHRNAIKIRIAFLSLSNQPEKHIKCVVYTSLWGADTDLFQGWFDDDISEKECSRGNSGDLSALESCRLFLCYVILLIWCWNG